MGQNGRVWGDDEFWMDFLIQGIGWLLVLVGILTSAFLVRRQLRREDDRRREDRRAASLSAIRRGMSDIALAVRAGSTNNPDLSKIKTATSSLLTVIHLEHGTITEVERQACQDIHTVIAQWLFYSDAGKINVLPKFNDYLVQASRFLSKSARGEAVELPVMPMWFVDPAPWVMSEEDEERTDQTGESPSRLS